MRTHNNIATAHQREEKNIEEHILTRTNEFNYLAMIKFILNYRWFLAIKA